MKHDIEAGDFDYVTKVIDGDRIVAQFENSDKAIDWIDKNMEMYQGKTLSIITYYQELEPLGDGSYDVREEDVYEEMGYDVPFLCTKCGECLNETATQPSLCGACA